MQSIHPYRPARRVATLVAVWVCFAILPLGHAQSAGLISGQRIPAGEGVDQLSVPNAYRGHPIGAAFVSNGQRPDLFVTSPRGIECALYFFRYVHDEAQGEPVFAKAETIQHPFGDKNPPPGIIYQDEQRRVHGFWLTEGKLVHTLFDASQLAFHEAGSIDIPALPGSPGPVAVHPHDGLIEVVYMLSNGVPYRPEGDVHTLDYMLYNGVDSFRGDWPYFGVYRFVVDDHLQRVVSPPALYSQSKSEILSSSQGLSWITYPQSQVSGYIAGSRLGNLYLFARQRDDTAPLAAYVTAVGPDGVALRHPNSDGAALAYPNAHGDAVDLIVGGEGGLFYYRFTGRFNEDGRPVYDQPIAALQEDADLYAQTLPVPSVADFDNDGAADLFVGNSAGQVLYYKNFGSNAKPRFNRGVLLEAGGRPIWIQPGYHGIQGPFEARWGYTCPTAADWNSDGMVDLILDDTTGNVRVCMNIGTPTEPMLDAPHPIYRDGLDLRGTWRVKPGVANLDGRMGLFILDDDNALHLYLRIDDHNVQDAGKLRMVDGAIITTHPGGNDYRPGFFGRSKIEAADWDGDGKIDLLIGGYRRNSTPNPDTGQPWLRYRTLHPCLQTILLRNVGTNTQPTYELEGVMQFRGEDLYLGAHSQTPAVCPFEDEGSSGGGDGPNLIYGTEAGYLYFFAHRDLSFIK